MKDTGKTINGVKLYSDPDCPPGIFYFIPKPQFIPTPTSHEEKVKAIDLGETLAKHYDKFRLLQPRRNGTLTEVEEQ